MVTTDKFLSRALLLVGCSALALSFITTENHTLSMPKGIYIRDYFGIDEGDVVAVPLPDAAKPLMAHLGALQEFDAGVKLLKYVAALSGDTVCREGQDILINGKHIGYALETSPLDGYQLPDWQGCRTLGENDIFLYTDYAPFSIDGRYFGVVSRSDATAYKPLLTWR